MDEKIITFLEKLATQLGTTAEYILGVYQTQAPIAGVGMIVGVVLGAIICAIFLCCFVWSFRNIDNSEGFIPVMIISGIITTISALVTIINCVCYSGSILTCFYNPQYWALQKLFSQIPVGK